MPTFELNDHIREILADTAEEDLDLLTRKVFESIPRNQTREALRQALYDAVRHVLTYAPRPGQSQFATQGGYAEAGSDSTTGEDQRPSGTHAIPVLPGGGNVRNSRAALLRRNRFRMSVWIGNRQFRHILECTRENLEFAAAESDRQAEANANTAQRYRRLVKKMAERHVATVGELSDQDIAEALNDE